MNRRRSVLVVGGGIAGLSAARRLASDHDVTVVEKDGCLGGKIQTTSFRGRPLDLGPDAFITRDPSAVVLCEELDLEEELLAPSSSSAAIYARGRIRPLPRELFIGVPSRIGPLLRSRTLSIRSVLRVGADLVAPGKAAPDNLIASAQSGKADPSVATVIGHRLGKGVLDTLIDPLVGGINASDIASLSLVASLPQLAERLQGKRSILRALRARRVRDASPPPRPMFLGLRGGLVAMIDRLTAVCAQSGVIIKTACPLEALRQEPRNAPTHWQALFSGEWHPFDAIVLATPAFVSAGLLHEGAPELADELAQIAYAGVLTVTLAFPAGAVPTTLSGELGQEAVLAGAGILVARAQRHLVTALSFTSTKWPRSANRAEVVVRASLGRFHDERAMTLSDDDLIDAVRGEIGTITGITAAPTEVRIQRWPDSFPQYVSGHLARVERIRQHLRDLGGLELAGAAYQGIGIPACVRSGESAARAVADFLAT